MGNIGYKSIHLRAALSATGKPIIVRNGHTVKKGKRSGKKVVSSVKKDVRARLSALKRSLTVRKGRTSQKGMLAAYFGAKQSGVRKSRKHAGRPKGSVSHCSVCGNAGHNAQTCGMYV